MRTNLAGCWICHRSAGENFLFSHADLLAFVRSGQVQRVRCDRPDRQLCERRQLLR
ncbi:hypothetical protein HNR42_001079 [Deinobacterium chartae]|uniref:Uncharacterized protein n=1 Tax=Deinobacterium chartae TaxID=521158 RepID=A0A841I0M5_9DEIO|nr:hypothetical protein [Deinobacterium chartae]MBB6097662.1 hypothetical protein [Deinobacterium chartae]